MQYTIIQVTKENQDGTVNGTLIQHCSGNTLDEATNRTRAYVVEGRPTKWTLIETLSMWYGVGHTFIDHKPCAPILSGIPQ